MRTRYLPTSPLFMGLVVVGRPAERHGVHVRLSSNSFAGPAAAPEQLGLTAPADRPGPAPRARPGAGAPAASVPRRGH